MYSRRALLGALAATAISASPALAQKAGTYQGTTTDNQGVTFVVSFDAPSATYSITQATLFFQATCRNSTDTVNEGEGFGLSVPITGGSAPINVTYADFNFTGTVYFVGAKMHGNYTTRVAKLSSSTSPPTQALFCLSPQKSFTGALQTTAAAAKPTPFENNVYDRKGRIVGVTTPR